MPTVLRVDGVRVAIYPNDHRPAHVHVLTADGGAVFVLHCPDGPPELREAFRLPRHELRDLQLAVVAALSVLCDAWEEIDGADRDR